MMIAGNFQPRRIQKSECIEGRNGGVANNKHIEGSCACIKEGFCKETRSDHKNGKKESVYTKQVERY